MNQRLRALSIGTVRQWHWISSAACLVGLMLFALTGITLNHAADIKTEPVITSVDLNLSPQQLKLFAAKDSGPLPLALRQWLLQEQGITTPNSAAEWSAGEVYLGMPSPGADAWLSIDLESGALLYESTERGTISYLNDLHKGRNTGPYWAWFLDIFSVLCLVFALSGLWLLARYAQQRPSTWPWVGVGVVAPLLLIILTIH